MTRTKRDGAAIERARIRRIIRKELRIYRAMSPAAFRGGQDEWERAIYVLEMILNLTHVSTAKRPR